MNDPIVGNVVYVHAKKKPAKVTALLQSLEGETLYIVKFVRGSGGKRLALFRNEFWYEK